MPPAPLTKREDEIRRLVIDGLTNEGIAGELGISARTVEAHLRMLFRKLGVRRREELASSPRPGRRPPADAGERVKALEQRLAARELQLRALDEVVKRMADRQFPLFDERVELVLVVGSRSSEDRVVERHWTTPNPYLIYRIIRPITPWNAEYPDYFETLALTIDVTNADIEVTADLVADSAERPLVLIMFQPGLQQMTEWELRYRTPGMWDPLRKSGTDEFEWSAGTLDGRHLVGLDDLTLRVEFPPGAIGGLEESRGYGEVERTPSGSSETLVFRDNSRTGGFFTWTLHMELAGADEARSIERDQPPPLPLPPDTPTP